MRSILATLGIVIGIFAVTVLQTAIEGINRAFEKSIAAVGADVLYVQKFEWFGKEDWNVYRNRRDINWSEYTYFANSIQGAESVCPSVGAGVTVTFKDFTTSNVFVIGTTDEWQRTTSMNIEEGRFFTKAESDGGWAVCVIGQDIKDAFLQV